MSKIDNNNPTFSIYSPVKTNIVSEIVKDSDDHTLVIWDVDGVLLIGSDRIFHSENIHSGLNNEYVDYMKNKYDLTPEQRDKFISQLISKRPVELVDKIIPNIMRDLKARHIKTIALTQYAVGPIGDIKSIEDWRIDELDKLGIKFDLAFKKLDQIELQKLPSFNGHHPLFKHGILFCNRSAKGDVLGSFLDIVESITEWKPNKIIFIDDKMESLELVQVELKRRNIAFIGLHYSVALDFPTEVDDKIVKLQYEHVMQNGIWLNDQMALEKLKNPTID